MNSKMKTITLFFFMVFGMISTSNGQITKGNWLVGGSGSFNSTTAEGNSNGITTTSKGSSIQINPNVGYFVSDKFAVGLNPYVSFGNPEGSNNNSFGFGIGPFARYYFLKADKSINVFSHIGYNYGKGYRNSESVNDSNNFVVKAGPVLYFNDSVGLELTLDYNISNINYNSSTTDFKTFSIGLGFQIHLEK